MKCWFCSIREAEEKHVLALEMYGDVDAKKTESETKVAYNVRHVEVPRCSDCHSRHKFAFTASVAAIIFVLSAAAAALAAAYSWVPEWIWGLWLGLSTGLTAASLLARYLSLKGIQSIRQARTIYPEIKELLEKSYKFGRRPKALTAGKNNSDEEK